MTEKNDSPQNTDLTADDLNLVDDKLADVGKGDDELWAEFEAADAPKKPDDADSAANLVADAPDDDTGDDTGDDADGAQAKDTGTPEASAEAGDHTDGADAAQADIWANATPEQRAELDALREAKAKAEQEAKRQSSRQSALQRRVNDLQKRLANPATKSDEPNDADTSGIEQDYPELAEPLKQAIAPLKERMTKDAEERQAAQEADKRAAQEELAEIVNEQTGILLDTHPDYEALLKEHGSAFGAWVEDQPRRIRDAAHRNSEYIFDAEGAIEVMSAFKAFVQPKPADEPAPASKTQETQPLNDRRQRQLDGSASPRSTAGRPAVSGIPKEGDPQAIWDAFEAQDQRASA